MLKSFKSAEKFSLLISLNNDDGEITAFNSKHFNRNLVKIHQTHLIKIKAEPYSLAKSSKMSPVYLCPINLPDNLDVSLLSIEDVDESDMNSSECVVCNNRKHMDYDIYCPVVVLPSNSRDTSIVKMKEEYRNENILLPMPILGFRDDFILVIDPINIGILSIPAKRSAEYHIVNVGNEAVGMDSLSMVHEALKNYDKQTDPIFTLALINALPSLNYLAFHFRFAKDRLKLQSLPRNKSLDHNVTSFQLNRLSYLKDSPLLHKRFIEEFLISPKPWVLNTRYKNSKNAYFI